MNNKLPNVIKVFSLLLVINITFAAYYYCSKGLKAEAASVSGESIFKSNCAGCHRAGQNLIKKDKPIIGSSDIKTKESLKSYLSVPHSPMPKFDVIANDAEKLEALQQYLLTLK